MDRKIPVWISEYVLAGYGTGAIMAVPCGDERDFKFAQHFNIPITNIIGSCFDGKEANPTKDALLENSDFLNGISMRDALPLVIEKLEAMGIGNRRVNYKIRDAAFSRQRYWGEPFPIVWKNGIAYPLDENELPLELPKVDSYKPGPDGEGPLANLPDGQKNTWRPIPCPAMRAAAGIFCAIWIPIILKLFAVVQHQTIGVRLISISEVPNMPWVICCIVVCGQNSFLILD